MILTSAVNFALGSLTVLTASAKIEGWEEDRSIEYAHARKVLASAETIDDM